VLKPRRSRVGSPTLVDPEYIETAAYDYYDKYWKDYWKRLRKKHDMLTQHDREEKSS
jgi:hypothetical protein